MRESEFTGAYSLCCKGDLKLTHANRSQVSDMNYRAMGLLKLSTVAAPVPSCLCCHHFGKKHNLQALGFF